MSGPIVVGVDDSKGARDAARVAAAISKRIDAPLIFVHVAADELAFPHGDVASFGSEPVVRLELGDPAERLAAVASEEGAEMLVVGSRGRGALAAALLGSVSRELVATSTCPVLVVPPDAAVPKVHRPGRWFRRGSVLCGIDGSAESHEAARAASRLAWQMDDRLVLGHVYRPATLWSEAGLARRYSLGPLASQWKAGLKRLEVAAAELEKLPEPELSLEAGDPVEELTRIAIRERAELLVVGSHERGRLRTALEGSAGGALAASAPVPVLVVPSAAGAHASDANVDDLLLAGREA
jgi:nucleotide-binding universal stress UspA family protein